MPEKRRTAWWKQAKLIVAAVLAVLLVVLIVQNRHPVQARVLFTKVSMPTAMLIGVAFLAGCAVGFLMGSYLVSSRRRS